jgi:hypothetical protein
LPDEPEDLVWSNCARCARKLQDPAPIVAGNVLSLAGIAALIGAVIWWFVFYSSVVREIGKVTGSGEGSVSDVVGCLYSSSGICGLVASVAVLAGKTAYEPMLFWFGLAGLILGVLIRFTAKPSGSA